MEPVRLALCLLLAGAGARRVPWALPAMPYEVGVALGALALAAGRVRVGARAAAWGVYALAGLDRAASGPRVEFNRTASRVGPWQ